MVHSEKRLAIAKDIFPRSYDGGGNHEFWDPQTSGQSDDVDDLYRNLVTKDIFSCAVPVDFEPSHYYFDIRGEHHESIEASVTHESRELHYPTAGIYRNLWRWMSAPIEPFDNNFFAESELGSRTWNTLVFRACQFQFQWNSIAKGGEFSKVTIEKSHWGSAVYVGCSKVRNGRQKYFKEPMYMDTKTTQLCA